VRSATLDYAKDNILTNAILAVAIAGKVIKLPSLVAAEKAGLVLQSPIFSRPDRAPLGHPQMTDLAAAVLYLAGPAGRYMTCQSIVLDAGFMIT